MSQTPASTLSRGRTRDVNICNGTPAFVLSDYRAARGRCVNSAILLPSPSSGHPHTSHNQNQSNAPQKETHPNPVAMPGRRARRIPKQKKRRKYSCHTHQSTSHIVTEYKRRKSVGGGRSVTNLIFFPLLEGLRECRTNARQHLGTLSQLLHLNIKFTVCLTPTCLPSSPGPSHVTVVCPGPLGPSYTMEFSLST